MSDKLSFLMCEPKFYGVEYVINPWMKGNVKKSSEDRAKEQWRALFEEISEKAGVERVEPRKGVPDMVFTANAGLVLEDKVILSRFYHPERRREEPYFKEWFAKRGFQVLELPPDIPFEGAGDALFDRELDVLWAGYGFRSELGAHMIIADWLDIEVLSLRLVDERFYHLDTCFCPLEGGYLMYYPPAFDQRSNALIEERVPAEKRIVVSEVDAVEFACNAVNIGKEVLMNRASSDLKDRLRAAGFNPVEVSLGEFIRAGGAAKCLTLRLNERVDAAARRPLQQAAKPVEPRVVRLEGHLIDTGVLSGALDAILEAGGSFQILSLVPGKQRQSRSQAEIKVFAPTETVLEGIIARLLGLGGVAELQQESDVRTKEVTQPGVAPDDFYISTIYPTEVRIGGEWILVEKQRMDAVVVCSSQDGRPAACCTLMRDLKVGQQVVVGIDGIRTKKRAVSLENSAQNEFSFMSAGVSSERRVELLVEQIAWELTRIREQNGKVVVTAGPVVIHTGGGKHLSWLIREGYVNALLGGNAIAVHDIEQAWMGTSLGVDLQRGVPVKGGHQHHLRAINRIRAAGGIAQAVQSGILTSGIFYECVKNGVPFSLAGSIRDDGPLPETRMDLIEAQSEYAELIAGADMILLLSSMLHSIGVGNMTPAGVKLICVDINPAVVTKLSDRGSLQSVGIVTDVGLFLSLLTKQLGDLAPAAANARG